MKYVDEFRDPVRVRALIESLRSRGRRSWRIMELCGGQTHSIVRHGLDELVRDQVELIHGPGCPVCVTPIEKIDLALEVAARPEVTFCTFGDMLRVPGSKRDLLHIKAEGGDVRAVYGPLEAVELAAKHPDRQVVFFAVGFETTAPVHAAAAVQARALGLDNFSLLTALVLVPPAMRAILSEPDHRIQGFLAAGHVCTVMGTQAYEPIAREWQVPIVVTGFEPVDILQGLVLCVAQLEAGQARVENQYARAVRPEGNRDAQALVERVFEVGARDWRGLGALPGSGLGLRDAFRDLDAEFRFPGSSARPQCASECISGAILQGRARPDECPAFGRRCTPDTPLGAPMVSSEGACSAYYRYRRRPAGGDA